MLEQLVKQMDVLEGLCVGPYVAGRTHVACTGQSCERCYQGQVKLDGFGGSVRFVVCCVCVLHGGRWQQLHCTPAKHRRGGQRVSSLWLALYHTSVSPLMTAPCVGGQSAVHTLLLSKDCAACFYPRRKHHRWRLSSGRDVCVFHIHTGTLLWLA
jgi:hypothetical protein